MVQGQTSGRGPSSPSVLLLTLAGAIAVAEGQDGINCSLVGCDFAGNLCGTFTQPCEVSGVVPGGASIWTTTSTEYRRDFSYRRVERGAFSRDDCAKNDPWLELTYEGVWAHAGDSATVYGASRGTVKIDVVWLRLVKERVCVPAVLPAWELGGYTNGESRVNRGERCYDTMAAVQTMCPCNGWSWSNLGPNRQRNIGMFCMPETQCSVLHDIYLHETHHFSYNATVSSACFTKVSRSQNRGWERPEDHSCIPKDAPTTCAAISAAEPRPFPWRSNALALWLALLAFQRS
mmetsp:Transcript_49589/g.106157  ORF Transcript_49589/g.106157 Transcript_49589/m.106157 type:complete len:290 (-) Transcript_49589:64-933(-)